MTESGQEFSGKTVEEAIADGLSALGMSQEDVDVEVISSGSRGILGFGSEPALVRLTLRTAETEHVDVAEHVEVAEPATPMPTAVEETEHLSDMPEVDVQPDTETVKDGSATDKVAADEIIQAEAEAAVEEETVVETDVEADVGERDEIDDEALAVMASDLLAQLISLMGFDAEIETGWQEPDESTASPYLLLDIRGDNLGSLIGRRGETLSSIQYLLRLMVNQQVRQWKNIVVDVEHYKQRRVAQLSQLAERMARQVAETGRSVTLEPMPGNERRIIHMTLRDSPDVFTESTGEGERRKVNIFPQR